MGEARGAWVVVPSIEHPTLRFRLGHDLSSGCEIELHISLHAQWGGSLLEFSLHFPLLLPPVLAVFKIN